MKRALLSVFALGLFTSLAGACARAPEDDRAPVAEAKQKTVVHRVSIEGAPAIGDAAAPVTLVMFTDYECPFCSKADATVNELRKQYGKKLRVVVRSFPLAFHKHARAAAIAARAAGEQGKFWEMHARLFRDGKKLDDAAIERIAAELDLDMDKFHTAMKSRAMSDAIDRDQAIGRSLDVRGTPASFVNGQRVEGAQPITALRALIDQEMEKADALIAKGTRPADVYEAIMKDAIVPSPSGEAADKPTAGDKADDPGCGCKGDEDPAAAAAEDERIEEVKINGAPFRGPASAPITVVVFSEFQCPFCARVEPTLRALEEEHKGRIRIVWKHNPLPFHEHASLAAKASIAAAEQGKFWEYKDALFSHQDALDRKSLLGYAQSLGLDMARFERTMDDPKSAETIAGDAAEGARLGVQGTPTFFINGRRLIGAQPISAFKAVIARSTK